MHLKMFLTCTLLITLSACSNQNQAGSSAQLAQSTAAPVTRDQGEAASRCPSQNFDTFLNAFADNIDIQKIFVHDPLESESIDASAEPEPKPVVQTIHMAELKFPLMPSTQQQAQDRLSRSITALSEREMRVVLSKEDTDYQMAFVFHHEDCWTLYRKQDESL